MCPQEPEDILRMSATASILSVALERELVQLYRGSRRRLCIQEVYDTVYLPRLIAISHQANRYVEDEDWGVLRQPLQPDLAPTQIRIVLEMLYLVSEIA